MPPTLAKIVKEIRTAVVFRGSPPPADPEGNVRALAIRDVVSDAPLQWRELPTVTVPDKYLTHCLQPNDVVLPSRGDYYKARLFSTADKPVLPVGQLNIIRPGVGLDAGYLVWYLNRRATQAKLALMLTGTGIKALTKASLMSFDIEVPDIAQQRRIAELDQLTTKIARIRHRLNELDLLEVTHVTGQLLERGSLHA